MNHQQQHEQQKVQAEEHRVLSIQSHVVSGYVGNKAAVFPLQLLGFDVDIINSVHFSNHTGHPNGFEGEIMNGDQLQQILTGLERNHLLSNIQHLLTGYIGSVTFLRSVLNVLKTLQSYNPNIRYVCDPVMGDDGKVYVPKELVVIYKEEVIPLANVVTPNQFEVELLTGIQIKSMEDGIEACKVLHDLGPDLVVITSCSFVNDNSNNDIIDNRQEDDNEIITILASQRSTNSQTGKVENQIWSIHTPKVAGRFTGTGDITAALILAWTAKIKNDLRDTLERIASTMYTLIKYTSDHATASAGGGLDGNRTIASRELKLIQNKDTIENPKIIFEAKKVL